MRSRVIIVLCCLLHMSVPSVAQLYKEMMYDPNVNFYDVIREADKYFENRDKGKGTGWAPYQRWKYANESRYYPDGVRNATSPYFTIDAFNAIVAENQTAPSIAGFEQGWNDLGPIRIETITGHYSPGLGRVEDFYVDPNDTLYLYLGSRSGGFWRSSDGGRSWLGTTDFLPASGVNCIAVSPVNRNVVYINIRNASNGVSHGIYRSSDGGMSWKLTSFNPTSLGKGGLGSSFYVEQVSVSPHNQNLIFICASDGLYRSADGLASWTKVLNGNFKSLAFHPLSVSSLYVYDATTANRNVVLRSADQGLTFTPSATIAGNNNDATVTISVSASCPNCVFFASNNGIWKSSDAGGNFTFVIKPPGGNGAFTVNDRDEKNMIYGGIDVVATTNGGQSFAQVTWWSLGSTSFYGTKYVHADLRVAKSVNGTLYLGTDGYLCKSKDGGTSWVRLSEGTGVRENYIVGLSQSNTMRSMCGSQDNGQSILTEKGWIEFYGADGMECIIHPLNDDWMMGSWQNGGRYRTKNGGQTGGVVTPPGQTRATWIAPLLFDPNNPMRVFSFSDSVYLSSDFGTKWQKLGPTTIGSVSRAAIAENNSNVILIASGAKLSKSVNGGASYTALSGLPNYTITDIAFDPRNDSVIVVTYNRYQRDSAKVFLSRNQGATWTNITFNLHDMPLNAVVIDHTPDANIYVGAEIGVYCKKMKDSQWQLFNPGLPNTSIQDLKIQYGANTLRAATWGRGLWEYALNGRRTYPEIRSVNITNPPTDVQPKQGTPQFVRAVVSYADSLSSVFVRWSKDTAVFNNIIAMQRESNGTYRSVTALPNAPTGTPMYFKVFAVGSQRDTSETYKYMYTVTTFKYCDAAGSASTGTDYVNYVELNGMVNPSAKEGYADFTASKQAILYTDSTYTLRIGLKEHFAGDTTAAWIDYNHNAVFDPNELIVMSEIDANGYSTSRFTVPSSVAADTTRMRVRSQYFNESPAPCDTRNGEVEDYTIVFRSAPRLLYSFGSNSLCVGATAAFDFTGDAVDSLRWELSNGQFTFRSVRKRDALTFTEPGVYHFSLTAFKDGKEFRTSDTSVLKVTRVNTDVEQSAGTLRSAVTSATYQWLDCSRAMAPVSGATSRTYQPAVDGRYALRITENNCTDTSQCFSVVALKVDAELNWTEAHIQPNPSAGEFTIVVNRPVPRCLVVITNLEGAEVFRTEFVDRTACTIDLRTQPYGVYYVRLSYANRTQYLMMMKTE